MRMSIRKNGLTPEGPGLPHDDLEHHPDGLDPSTMIKTPKLTQWKMILG